MSLHISPDVVAGLRAWAEKCYPFEGCGILLGEFFEGGVRRVKKFSPLTNLLRDKNKAGAEILRTAADTLGRRVESRGEFEFVMDPAEFNAITIDGEKEGLDVVGILHTHPDHPAAPSAADAAQPLLSGWSNVIVKVDAGRYVEARSWVRDDESRPFEEEPLLIE